MAGSEFFFAARDRLDIDETTEFAPKFDNDGLITCVVIEVGTNVPLMVAHMNEEALARTIRSGEAWYWSRSRQEFWKKGGTSGNTQNVIEIRTDCDQDVILLRVEVAGHGASCHTGRHACFYRRVEFSDESDAPRLRFVDDRRVFDPKSVYENK